MANLIDYTYFVDNCNIPNADDTGVLGTALREQLDRYITRYQDDYLIKYLGQTLRDQFIAGLALTPVPAKWTALKNQLRDVNAKISPITQYVAYWWMRDNMLTKMATGDGKLEGANVKMQVNEIRMCDLYNEMVRLNLVLDTWIKAHLTDYPDYNPNYFMFSVINPLGL